MRRVFWSAAAACALASASAAAQGPPPTDVYLAPLSMQGGKPVVGAPVNLTHRPGYDNQPSFTPDSRAILFTSVREDGQSDIYRYDLAAKTAARVTSTPESEYSATVMPGGKRFSVIRVERDMTQRLWSFALDGSDPRLVIDALKPVGYHAWIDANNLALFVLGSPNALVHTDVASGKCDTLVRDIGRSLAPLPGVGFSFTHRVDSAQMLATMRWPGGATRDLIALPRGSQDIAWLSSDLVLTTSGTKLLSWRSGAASWTEVADFAGAGLKNLNRVAVSPDGKWLAIVADPQP